MNDIQSDRVKCTLSEVVNNVIFRLNPTKMMKPNYPMRFKLDMDLSREKRATNVGSDLKDELKGAETEIIIFVLY